LRESDPDYEKLMSLIYVSPPKFTTASRMSEFTRDVRKTDWPG